VCRVSIRGPAPRLRLTRERRRTQARYAPADDPEEADSARSARRRGDARLGSRCGVGRCRRAGKPETRQGALRQQLDLLRLVSQAESGEEQRTRRPEPRPAKAELRDDRHRHHQRAQGDPEVADGHARVLRLSRRSDQETDPGRRRLRLRGDALDDSRPRALDAPRDAPPGCDARTRAGSRGRVCSEQGHRPGDEAERREHVVRPGQRDGRQVDLGQSRSVAGAARDGALGRGLPEERPLRPGHPRFGAGEIGRGLGRDGHDAQAHASVCEAADVRRNGLRVARGEGPRDTQAPADVGRRSGEARRRGGAVRGGRIATIVPLG